MTDEDIMPAAWAAYEAFCIVMGDAPDQRAFKVEIIQWLAVARAVVRKMPADPQWPLKARVWTRTSVEPHEKVLEIEGVIGDTHMTCRHTQSIGVPDEDVPGLPEMYPDDDMPADVSLYARNIAEHLGVRGLAKEARRLVDKIETAASLLRDGTAVKIMLAPNDPMGKRIDHSERVNDVVALAREVDLLQDRIVKAQRASDPFSRTSLVLHTDRKNWERYDSYVAYLDRFDVKGG